MRSPQRVTFDTNTLRALVTAFRAQQQGNASAFAGKPEMIVLEAIQTGKVLPRASDTVLTLEGVQRKDRVVYFGGYKPNISITESAGRDGSIKVSFSIAPGTPPTLNKIQVDRLNDFVSLGGLFMLIPRIGSVPRPKTITDALVVEMADERKQREEWSAELVRKIEAAQASIYHAKQLAHRLNPQAVPWTAAFKNAVTSQDENAVGDAIAEWADGDFIAAHYGYGNDVLCTDERSKGASSFAAMSAENRAWLTADYGVRFMTLEELAYPQQSTCKIF